MTKRVAGLDIGTNTILMLIAEAGDDGHLNVIADCHDIARLGENLRRTGEISVEAAARAEAVLGRYRAICLDSGVTDIVAAGTSAMRDARNGKETADRLSRVIGSDIQIISGVDEARLSYFGSVEESPASLIDIGGGSTEIISGSEGRILNRVSLDVGVVKVTEEVMPEHPPAPSDIVAARKMISGYFSSLSPDFLSGRMYAVAGTPTTLAQIALGLDYYDAGMVEGYSMKLSQIEQIAHLLQSMELVGIIEKWNIHPQRADVLIAGTLILEEAMRYFSVRECTVSIKGLRYGLVKEFLAEGR